MPQLTRSNAKPSKTQPVSVDGNADMKTEQFLKLIKTFPYRDNYESEDVYTYPDGGSIYVRLNPRDAPDCYDIVATGEAIPFAKACLGNTKLEDAKGYPRWRVEK